MIYLSCSSSWEWPTQNRPTPLVDPEARRRRLLATLNRLVKARSLAAPALIVLEDVHWIDRGSAAFLENLVPGIAGMRTLLLVTYRPEYRGSWQRQAHATELRLQSLDQEDADLLLSSLLGDDPSVDRLAGVLRERTAGNPFFIEEMVAGLVQRGSLIGRRDSYLLMGTVDAFEIPETIEAVLAARIDRLPDREKSVLQGAAVIGREFSGIVLRGVIDLPEPELADALNSLVKAEMLFAGTNHDEYEFKHALGQEVAYHSQLAKRRARLHGRVAQRIADVYPDRHGEVAALIAYHWQAAGEMLQATKWMAQAATWVGFNDPFEAQRRWRAVGRLADDLPDSPEGMEQRLGSQLMMLNFAWRLGIPEDETAESFERQITKLYREARELAAATGNLALQAAVVANYGTIRGFTGDLHEWLALTAEGVAIARQAGRDVEVANLPGLLYARWSLGSYRELLSTVEHALEVIGDDAELGRGVNMLCPVAYVYLMLGWARAMLGRHGTAMAACETALALARDRGDAETENWTRMAVVEVAKLGGGDRLGALAGMEQAVEVMERIGGAFSRRLTLQYLGMARAMCEQWSPALEALERAREIARSRGLGFESEPQLLELMACSHLGLGNVEAAISAARQAVGLAVQRGTKGYELQARLALARALRAADGTTGAAEVATELSQCRRLLTETGARALEPRIRLELASLAQLRGDTQMAAEELRAVDRLRREMGTVAVEGPF